MAKIFRPNADNGFRARQNSKRQKQKHWTTPALATRYIPSAKFKLPLVHRTLIRVWQYLHHFSSHAPAAVEVRYRKAAKRFEARHLANAGNGSCRFVNKYTAHRWL